MVSKSTVPSGLALYQKHAKVYKSELQASEEIVSKDAFKKEVRRRCDAEKTIRRLEEEAAAKPESKPVVKKKAEPKAKPVAKKKAVAKPKAKAKPVAKKKAAVKKLPSFKSLGITSARKATLTMMPELVAQLQGGSRFDSGNIVALQKNIELVGCVYEPIILKFKDESLEIVKGKRRVEAVKRLIKKGANIAPVPITLVDDATALKMGMSLNIRKQLNPLEEAAVLYYNKDDVPTNILATLLGTTLKCVNDRISLIGACGSVKKAVVKEQITCEAAANIARKHPDDPKEQNIQYVELVGKKVAEKVDEVPQPQKVQRRALKQDDGFISPVRARNLLSTLSSAYTMFRRSELPATKTNESWLYLEDLLRKVRNLKTCGKIPIN